MTNPDESTNEYTYDDAGNRLTKITTSGETVVVTNYTYDEQNRLVKIEQGADIIENAYTADGKKLSRKTNN